WASRRTVPATSAESARTDSAFGCRPSGGVMSSAVGARRGASSSPSVSRTSTPAP
ncbi:MAG: LSU ribosomal protein L34p, partial [uncultured Gemmatimonadaceae bacterium]